MKKLFFVLLLSFGCFFAAQAQDQTYRSAVGLRLGFPVSVSYKQFISDPGAIEVFAGFRSWGYGSWFNVAGLYQHHFPINNAPGLQWYVGGGASVFFWNYDNDFLFDDDYNSTQFGILGDIGLDYKFANAPINLSVDWLPVFFLGNGYLDGFGGGYGALSARYTLK